MSGKQVPFHPQSESPLLIQMDEKHLAALFTMIEEIVARVVEQRLKLATEKPMNANEARKFLGYSDVNTIRIKTRQGLIPSHELEPGGHRFYYASEINEKIKGKRK